jgi:hypothetical protein
MRLTSSRANESGRKPSERSFWMPDCLPLKKCAILGGEETERAAMEGRWKRTGGGQEEKGSEAAVQRSSAIGWAAGAWGVHPALTYR